MLIFILKKAVSPVHASPQVRPVVVPAVPGEHTDAGLFLRPGTVLPGARQRGDVPSCEDIIKLKHHII